MELHRELVIPTKLQVGQPVDYLLWRKIFLLVS